jgi:hypothetical protein
VAGVGYCFVVLAAWMLPETNGIALDAVEGNESDETLAHPARQSMVSAAPDTSR